ncbi:Hsp20/alpha crystallin family protein [Lewinella sp. W8]|uniref:Hsp20/alpha crystallin family protein n=1 Tax=Lewinella sp. W8 TaxID=2528208 RepID=UPI0010689BDF|nr:Hsp20/alpha crystallin family protein [Lewinella sp. W8]MTB50136.1 Hsp20 family protein [Lewinella sp. W8]
MKLINYNPALPSDLFRFFDDPFTKAKHGFRPAVNIIETEDAFKLEVLAPGRNKDLFNVAFDDGTLEISYTAEKEGAEVKPDYRRKEFSLADFTRRFTLDNTVIDDEAIEATYVDGVLRLHLPKRETALSKAPRQIAVG